MGMVLNLISLGDENIQKVLKDPPLIWQVIAPDDEELYLEERKKSSKGKWFSGLFKSGNEVGSTTIVREFANGEFFENDLDKAWHGIHYLLTGTDYEGEFPLNFLLSGETVGNIDVGYGPARVFMTEDAKVIYETISKLPDEELRRHFNPSEMMKKKIYPDIWDRDPKKDDTLGYLMEYVQILRNFLHQVVKDKVGFVIYIS